MKRKSLIALVLTAVMVFACVGVSAEYDFSTFTATFATKDAAATNLALNKSYTYQYTTEEGGALIDFTIASGKSHTDSTYDELTRFSNMATKPYSAVFTLDFGTPTLVNTILLNDYRNGGFNKMKISVANTNDANTEWKEVISGDFNWIDPDPTNTTNSNRIVYCKNSFAPQYARYIKIEMTDKQGYYVRPKGGTEYAGSLMQVQAFNIPYSMTRANYANADEYTNVTAYAPYNNNSDLYGNSWFATNGIAASVTPSKVPSTANQRAHCAWLQGSAKWMAVDLGAERNINTLQLIPYYGNINKFTLYSATAEQYAAITGITTNASVDSAVELGALTKLCEGSGMGIMDNDTPNGAYNTDVRDFVVSASFNNATARYLILTVDELVGTSSETRGVCYIKSFEVYNWNMDDVSTADATAITTGETYTDAVASTAVVANITAPKSGWQKENKQVVVCEYKTDGSINNISTHKLSIPAGEAVVFGGTYVPKADTAKIKVFAWEADGTLVPLTAEKEITKVQ